MHYSDCPLFSPLSHEKKETRVDRILTWAKTNPVVSVLIVAAIAVGGIATSAGHISALLNLIKADRIVLASRVVSGESLYRSSVVSGDTFVHFEPNNQKQTLQRIVLRFPKEVSQDELTLAPPFTTDLEFQLSETNAALQSRVPNTELKEPYRMWMSKGSVPVAVTADYITSAGDRRTDTLLYEMDVSFTALQECNAAGSCIHPASGIQLTNFRYVRLLSRSEDLQLLVDTQFAGEHFDFQPGR
jgi:hypothetical protein